MSRISMSSRHRNPPFSKSVLTSRSGFLPFTAKESFFSRATMLIRLRSNRLLKM